MVNNITNNYGQLHNVTILRYTNMIKYYYNMTMRQLNEIIKLKNQISLIWPILR